MIKTEESVNFLNTTPGETAATWSLMNKGIESATVAMNPNVGTRHYIADSNATSVLGGYAKQLDITQYAFKGDAVFAFIDDLFFNEKIGEDVETEILQVFYHRSSGGTNPTFDAKKSACIVVPDSENREGGEQLSIGYNVFFCGDPVFGTVAITAGKPTFTPTV